MGERSKKVSTTLEKLKIKPLKSNYTPFLHTSISFYVALASFIPFALLEKASISGTPEDFSIFQIDPVGLVGLFYMAIISSIVAYVAFQWGLERARVSDSALFSYLGPLFTIPIAFILLGEVPSSFAILGTAVIACGVVLAEFRRG